MQRFSENVARLFGIGLALGVILGAGIASWLGKSEAVEVRLAMPENGGFSPADLTVEVGQPLHLRLTSVDVVHGFAIGQSDLPPLDVEPGQVTETTLVFDRPGKYTYYCTRWCGPNHWRMRGTIEVTGPLSDALKAPPPLYVILGLDIDASHPALVVPDQRPSAQRGSPFLERLPAQYRLLDYYQTHSPAQAWLEVRQEPALDGLSDQQLWDLVAAVWVSHTTPQALQEAGQLYAANCAACHGEEGAGDGVMAEQLVASSQQLDAGQSGEHAAMSGHAATTPTSFADPANMLGASPAVLQGKIMRGGMGTGMPYWGPIFTDQQIWAMVSYLWTFQFDYGG